MIRKTLAATQIATYSIDLPTDESNGMPVPTGTGFFVSDDGWFVTAAHVVTKDNRVGGEPRDDIKKAWLMKESRPGQFGKRMCQYPRLELIEPALDFALLKLDFEQNSSKIISKESPAFLISLCRLGNWKRANRSTPSATRCQSSRCPLRTSPLRCILRERHPRWFPRRWT